MREHFTTFDEWHNQENSLFGLKSCFHVDQERMLDLLHDLNLIHYALHHILLDDHVFSHCFHSIESLRITFMSNKEDFAESSSTKDFLDIEIRKFCLTSSSESLSKALHSFFNVLLE
jgi:hypothetical protein